MMVRQRKQVKPSGVRGDVVEATLTSLDTRSPLVNLPAEVHGIITSFVRQSLIQAIHMYRTALLMRLL